MSAKIDLGYSVWCGDCLEYLGTYYTTGEADEAADKHNKAHHPKEMWPWKLK